MTTNNASAWNNGNPDMQTGSGYGLRIDSSFSHTVFQPNWSNIVLHLRGQINPITINLSNSAISGNCTELRHQEIGRWLIANNNTRWPSGKPPRFTITQRGNANIFDVV